MENNEITGVIASDGGPSVHGHLGEERPDLFDGWRLFYTQQHGDNPTYEVVETSPERGH